jgi:hypothetical protein
LEKEDFIEKTDAELSYFFGIQFPEKLPDEVYWPKFRQLQWLKKEIKGDN